MASVVKNWIASWRNLKLRIWGRELESGIFKQLFNLGLTSSPSITHNHSHSPQAPASAHKLSSAIILLVPLQAQNSWTWTPAGLDVRDVTLGTCLVKTSLRWYLFQPRLIAVFDVKQTLEATTPHTPIFYQHRDGINDTIDNYLWSLKYISNASR